MSCKEIVPSCFFSPALYSQFSLVVYLKSRDRDTDTENKCMDTKGEEKVG